MTEVHLELSHDVAVLTIDRPHARNAIGLGTMAELDHALSRAESSNATVLVIRGAGDRAFVSGGDLKELSAIRDEAGAATMATRMRRVLDRIALFPVPVIAALNGHALGGGAEVAVAASRPTTFASASRNRSWRSCPHGVAPSASPSSSAEVAPCS